MDKFKNKYRIPSARLQSWDYGANGAYFITICTHNREHFFGKIINGEMQLNELGEFAEKFWADIPIHFPFVELGNFVIMPNHTHGILIINRNGDIIENGNRDAHALQALHCNVSAVQSESEPPFQTESQTEKSIQMAKISPKPGSISTIIRSYKSVVSKNARLIHSNFAWQTRFHDHIIRDSRSFENIQNYIMNNPKKWQGDTFQC